uniref:Kinesin family member 4A [Xenopus (Silurana) tropicalis] n=1 Tax=Lepeophtheirus salmonis TaxID=72036 RepID=A0A0K2V8S9_LEPSM
MEEELDGGEDSLTPVVVTARIRPPGHPGLSILQDERSLVLEGARRTFRFDRVLGPQSSQEDLYNFGGPKDFLPLALDGYDLNFLGYGERKSGKSFSLFGGILPSFLKDLFARLPPQFSLKVSFVDILDENILDLLSAEPNSPSWMSAHTPAQVFHALQTGLSILKKRPQDLFESSTSHSIFTLRLITQSGGYKKTSFIKFIDVAGSDYYLKKKMQSNNMSHHVDLGLLSLVNVVSALGDPRRNASVIPYADSALTRFIGEAFGGNSVTLLLATLIGNDLESTLNTCIFAELASNIKNHPTPNITKESNDNEDNDDSISRRDSDVSLFRSASIPNSNNQDVSLCFSPPMFQEGRRPPEGVTHAPIPLRPTTSPLALRSPLNVQMYYDSTLPSSPLRLPNQYDYQIPQRPNNFYPNLMQYNPLVAHNNNQNILMNNNQLPLPNGFVPPTHYNTGYSHHNANLTNTVYNKDAASLLNAQLNSLTGQFQRLSTYETQSPIDIMPVQQPAPQKPVVEQDTAEQHEESKNNPKLERIEEESETCVEVVLDSQSEEEEDFDSEAEEEIEPLLLQIQETFRSHTRNHFEQVLGTDFYESPAFKPVKTQDKNAISTLRKELSDLTASNIESQNAIVKTDKDLRCLQDQLKELKSSIQVKETLIQDLLKTEEETKVINKKFKFKLRLLEEKSHNVRKDLRGAQRLVREFKGDSNPELQSRVKQYNDEIEKLEEKISDTEKVLKFNIPETPSTQGEILNRMKEEHSQLQSLLNQELSRKNALEDAVTKDQFRIKELEMKLREQQHQLNLSLKLSQDLEKQRDQLQSEAARLQSQINNSSMYHFKEDSSSPEKSEKSIRQEIANLRDLKDDLIEERSQLETRYQSEKRSGKIFSKKDEFRIVELDVILEAMDACIDVKNSALCGNKIVVVPSTQRDELLLNKLSALSIDETRSLLRKFVYRTIDLRTEGNRCQAELDLSEDDRHRLYRKLQELNYHYSSREVAYERKLDIQKTEHLKQISALRKQINDPDAYEFKLKQLKDEVHNLKQDSQRYKRFYKAYHKHFDKKEEKSSSSSSNTNHHHIRSSLFPNVDMPPPQKVTRERKKLIVQSKVPSAKPKRK